MQSAVKLFGARYSVYVRIVLAVLHEKGVAYDLVPVDVFAKGGVTSDYLARHPFGRIPAFEHDGFQIYETSAITRYVDEAFSGPTLQPTELRDRTRMNQMVAMLDNYGYRPMVWDVYVERVVRAQDGVAPDEERIAGGVERSRTFLQALSDRANAGRWLAGTDLSLADLHAAPIFDYFSQSPEGATLLREFPGLDDWWARIRLRPAVAAALA